MCVQVTRILARGIILCFILCFQLQISYTHYSVSQSHGPPGTELGKAHGPGEVRGEGDRQVSVREDGCLLSPFRSSSVNSLLFSSLLFSPFLVFFISA